MSYDTESLESKIDSLEDENAALRARLEDLEELLDPNSLSNQQDRAVALCFERAAQYRARNQTGTPEEHAAMVREFQRRAAAVGYFVPRQKATS